MPKNLSNIFEMIGRRWWQNDWKSNKQINIDKLIVVRLIADIYFMAFLKSFQNYKACPTITSLFVRHQQFCHWIAIL